MALDTNTLLLIILILLVVVGFIATFWFVNQRVGQVDERVGQVQSEVRYEIVPEREAAIERSILVVLGARKRPVGVAFFVSGYTALTVRHNLLSDAKQVLCKRLTDRRVLTFTVKHSDAQLDFAVLQLSSGEDPSLDFLPIAENLDVFKRESMFLVTCGIRLAKEAPEAADVGMALHKARITRCDKPHHFLYDASSFDGDSGGAVVVARTGHVIGLHQQLVNAAEELVQRKSDVGERLTAVERSLKSLVRGNAHGCVGLRADAKEVQAALK